MGREALLSIGAMLSMALGCFSTHGTNEGEDVPPADDGVDAALPALDPCNMSCVGTAVAPDGTHMNLFIQLQSQPGVALVECFTANTLGSQESFTSCEAARAVGCGIGHGTVVQFNGPTKTRRVEYRFGAKAVEVAITDEIFGQAAPIPPKLRELPYAKCRTTPGRAGMR